jgi:hypothetical protein
MDMGAGSNFLNVVAFGFPLPSLPDSLDCALFKLVKNAALALVFYQPSYRG